MTLVICPAEPDDVPAIHSLIRALADYERLLPEMKATEDDLAGALFGAAPRVFCDVARLDGQAVGFALWFYTFSTFVGRHGIWLEDLFVQPERRGSGIGKALLSGLAARCLAENLGRLEWTVLDWNTPSIDFYESLGARPMSDWTTYRLDGAALAATGGKAS